MEKTLAAQVPFTPEGSPLATAPVAPVVENVTGAIAVLMHLVCAIVDAAEVKAMVLLFLD
jgi:hypothetical protein